jgi:DNA-binding LacI/PurR family transcriptional regulator
LPATIADVARAAGVSRATVSYVLNATAGQSISEPTRKLVLNAAARLGYTPNLVARNLRRGRSDAVLCPLPGLRLTHPVATLVEACASALERQGLFLVPDFSRHDEPGEQLAAMRRLAPAAVLDVLLRPDDPVLRALREAGIPVLSTRLATQQKWESAADAYGRHLRLTQLDYLISQGHRRIITTMPPTFIADSRTARTSISDARRMMRAAGGRLTVEGVELDPTALRAAVASWMDLELPEAVAAYNDDYAIAVIAALRERNIAVPRDVAVMGIDDNPLGAVHTPTLTTIRSDFTDLAEALANAAVATLKGNRDLDHLPVPRQTVVQRESA